MSMIERMAAAFLAMDPPGGDAMDGYRALARTALETLREPTEGMVLAGAPMLGRPCDEEAQGYAREAYWTMIQAALEGEG